MENENRPFAADTSARYRHPATVFLLGWFAMCVLFLNFWQVEWPSFEAPPFDEDRWVSTVHGFPFKWLERDLIFPRRDRSDANDGLSRLKQKLQTSLPWTPANTVSSGRLLVLPWLGVDLAIGGLLFLPLRGLADRFFGFRPVPAWRFGVLTALAGMTATALVFAVDESFLFVAALLTYAVALLGPLVRLIVAEVDNERAVFAAMKNRRRKRKSQDAEREAEQEAETRALAEIERTDVGPLKT
jgi:hypothetical protein